MTSWEMGSLLLPRWTKIAIVCLVGNALLVEFFTQLWWMLSCSWPHSEAGGTRIVVVADPQLTDRSSYDFARSGVALWAVRLLCDTYLKRAFSLVRSLRPEAVVFMGDLMDGARHYGPDEFWSEFARFRRIARLHDGTPEMHVAGNHDIGLGHSLCVSCAQRFADHVSPLSFRMSIGNVSFIAIDTVTTAGSVDAFSCLSHRHFRSEAHRFTSQVSEGRVSLDWRGVASPPPPRPPGSQDPGGAGPGGLPEVDCRPRVLLTHIPLYRKPNTDCGPGRGAKNQPISYMVRHTFQTSVSKELSKSILEAARPDLVLSGDDHDQCRVEHAVPWGGAEGGGGGGWVEERTVGTVSMLQGNIYPSIALLTLDQAAASRRVEACQAGEAGGGRGGGAGRGGGVVGYKVCTLPPQLPIYYETGAVFGIVAALLLCARLWNGRLMAAPAWYMPARAWAAAVLWVWDVLVCLVVAGPVWIGVRLLGDAL